MKKLLGRQFEEFMLAHKQPPYKCIRLNTHRLSSIKEEWIGEAVPWCSFAFYVPYNRKFEDDPLWQAGYYYVQEPSTTFYYFILSKIFHEVNKPLILDMCASPGGKTTILSSFFDSNSLIIANEVSSKRIGALFENVRRWGCHNTIITQHNPRTFTNFPETFDIVVVDAPCSSEGQFRKDPKIMKKWTPSLPAYYSKEQRTILDCSVLSLKTGGFLIYSTCTYEPAENHRNVEYLIEKYDMEPVSIKVPQEWGIEVLSDSGAFIFYPHKVKGEGFFLALLRKTKSVDLKKHRVYMRGNSVFVPPSPSFLRRTEEFVLYQDDIEIVEWRHSNQEITIIPGDFLNLPLLQHIKILYCGFPFAIRKQSDYILASDLPFSWHFNSEHLKKEEIIDYRTFLPLPLKNYSINEIDSVIVLRGFPLILKNA